MAEISRNADFGSLLADLALYVAAVVFGLALQVLFVYPTIFFIFVRTNPYAYYRKIASAVLTAFATASSAATLPVTLRNCEEAGLDPEICRFSLPLGATVNMDGAAIGFPIAVIFIAELMGVSLSTSQQIVVAIVAAFVSMGAAPVPNAGLVYIVLLLSRFVAAVLLLFLLNDE